MPDTNQQQQENYSDLIARIKEKTKEVRDIDYIEKLKDTEQEFVNYSPDPRVIGQFIAYKVLLDILGDIGLTEALTPKTEEEKDKDDYKNTGRYLNKEESKDDSEEKENN